MTKEKTIENLRKGHEHLKKVIEYLSDQKMTMEKILGDWTIKEIVAHLSAWNWEQSKAIDDLLSNQKPKWWGLDESKFNQEAIEKRKDWSLDEILKEWEESFKNLISRVSNLSNTEWFHESCEKGNDRLPVNIDSMLNYKYQGEDHEGGHARQIEEFLGIQK